jgi:hypothetical protein
MSAAARSTTWMPTDCFGDMAGLVIGIAGLLKFSQRTEIRTEQARPVGFV